MQQKLADAPPISASDILKVLYVEDSLADFSLAERRLRKEGWNLRCLRVDSLPALTDALEFGDWDLALVDYNVPGLPFDTVFAAINGRMPDIPLVLVTGSVGEESVIEMMRMGAWDVVLKVNLARLSASIRRCLREAGERRARRSAEADLKTNEARLTLALGAAELGVWNGTSSPTKPSGRRNAPPSSAARSRDAASATSWPGPIPPMRWWCSNASPNP